MLISLIFLTGKDLKNNDQEFKLPPISPLIGSSISNYFKVLSLGKILPRVYPNLFLTFLGILFAWPFQVYERIYFRKKIKNFQFDKPPVFIIGHWRSGTTYLHNLLCKDPTFGYITTYQGVFPNNMKSQWIFKSFMQWKMPKTRPGDQMELGVDLPQEEEFALANMTHMTFYHFFYMPSTNDMLYEKYVRGLQRDDEEGMRNRRLFKRTYFELLVKAVHNVGREQLVIKNPLNTAKIKLLLEMFPDAKFIHIYRNPVITYLSTKRFFSGLIPTLCLEKYDPKYIHKKILENYKNLMQDFFEIKNLIPEKNLYELKFEDFEKDSLHYLKEIYAQFGLTTWDLAEEKFKAHIASQTSYKKSVNRITKQELDRVLKDWSFAMEKWQYSLPENLEVL